MFQAIQTLLVVGGVLFGVLIVCLSLPNSKLRDFLLPIVGWGVVLLAGLYAVSPLDLVPDVVPVLGWIDDAGAIALGLGSAIAALTAKGKGK
jgi:hypothetical protein